MEFLPFIIAGLSLAWVIVLHGRLKAVEKILDSLCDNQRNISGAVQVLDRRLGAVEQHLMSNRANPKPTDHSE
jgi:hypothetical protein